MFLPRYSRPSRRGFTHAFTHAYTLIELFVVIAIVTVIAAILLPVFQKVRERARLASCASNEKQLGLGVLMYVQDSNEALPPRMTR